MLLSSFFFFLMIRRPPRSTLFPYTTPSDLGQESRGPGDHVRGQGHRVDAAGARRDRATPRSEEHTSELQSQSNLVCRLLLEKKKKRQRELRYEQAPGSHNRPSHVARMPTTP